MLFFHLCNPTLAQQKVFGSCGRTEAGINTNIWAQERKRAYFAGSLLLADLALPVSLAPLLLLKLADEVRAMLLNQTHLDGAMVGL